LNWPAARYPLFPGKPCRFFYKGQRLKKEYEADLICYQQIIVELKALDRLSGREEAQLLNYLKATGLRVGLLINFGSVGKLEWQRFVK
jgi:GxxExxY protein